MPKNNKNTATSYIVPALERGLKILEMLSEHPSGLLMGEMKELQLPTASLYRMLVTLTELGYIIRDEHDRYHLGRKLLSVGYKGISNATLPEKAAPFMRKLRDLTNETVALGVLSGGEGVVIDTVHSEQPVCVYVKVGHHFPLHTAAPAKAMLAYLPDDELERQINKIKFTKFTDRTITDKKAFSAELEKVKNCGAAYDMGEEAGELRCVAAAIFDSRNYPAAAIWITGPESRLDEEKLKQYGKLLKQTADEIANHII